MQRKEYLNKIKRIVYLISYFSFVALFILCHIAMVIAALEDEFTMVILITVLLLYILMYIRYRLSYEIYELEN